MTEGPRGKYLRKMNMYDWPATFHVKVFKESAEWDHVEKWWMLSHKLLNELFVAEYECSEEFEKEQVDEIAKKHPNCVLCY